MKSLIIISVFILAIINLNCGSSELAAGEKWKEKYGIKPGTGVLYGNFVLKVKTELRRYHFYLIKEEGFSDKAYLFDERINKQKMEEELTNALQDSIGLHDSTMLIKNIPPGEYILFAFGRETTGPGYSNFGYSIFESNYCDKLKIAIKEDSITYFPGTETVPGKRHETDNMDISTGRVGENPPPGTCDAKTKNQVLNEENYLQLIKRTK
jgi:hypothetical protein